MKKKLYIFTTHFKYRNKNRVFLEIRSSLLLFYTFKDTTKQTLRENSKNNKYLSNCWIVAKIHSINTNG